jgi:hypothetical protein
VKLSLERALILALVESGPEVVFILLCGGDGVVRIVELPESATGSPSDLEEAELLSDSEESGAGLSTRRRIFIGGPSSANVEAEDIGDPRKKFATACEARSYLRNSASSSLRRFPGLTPGDVTGCLPLLLAGATSLRLVKEPSS